MGMDMDTDINADMDGATDNDREWNRNRARVHAEVYIWEKYPFPRQKGCTKKRNNIFTGFYTNL
jgi:hypothetical protein